MGMHDKHRRRKRAQFLSGGLDGLSDYDVLELLLFYAIPRRNTNDLAHALIDEFGNLENVLLAPIGQLEKVPGIGENSALLLKLIPALHTRLRQSRMPEKILQSTDQAGEYFAELLRHERREVVYQMCVDRKGRIINCCRLSEGSVDLAVLDARRVAENALLSDATGVLLAHNHPSGVALPSAEDRQITLQVRDALRLMGITLIDHIVVADGDFVSMAASGDLLLPL
ncbi:MAG: DNA repair protein RadC [Clostridiales bacterium]|nr:DNA repair protein RadC [Candidatus Cacconaster stercorequi]